MRTKVAVAAAALLITLAGCSDDAADPAEETTSPAEVEQEGTEQEDAAPSPPEPDLDGVPDVVAEVDGVEISRDDFAEVYDGQLQQAFMQTQMTGEDVDQDAVKQQTAEGMVDTELMLAEVSAREIATSEEEVTAAADELAASSGMGSADELFAALEEQGLSRDEAMDQLQQQTAIDQLITDEAGEFSAEEDELRALYDSMVAQGGGAEGAEVPEFEEMRPQLEQQMRQQHEGQAVQGLLEQLREGAEITYHL